jgi:hypothetical protein
MYVITYQGKKPRKTVPKEGDLHVDQSDCEILVFALYSNNL